MSPQAVRLEDETINKLKNLEIELGGVRLKSHDAKVNHLIWFFEHYKNNNGKTHN